MLCRLIRSKWVPMEGTRRGSKPFPSSADSLGAASSCTNSKHHTALRPKITARSNFPVHTRECCLPLARRFLTPFLSRYNILKYCVAIRHSYSNLRAIYPKYLLIRKTHFILQKEKRAFANQVPCMNMEKVGL